MQCPYCDAQTDTIKYHFLDCHSCDCKAFLINNQLIRFTLKNTWIYVALVCLLCTIFASALVLVFTGVSYDSDRIINIFGGFGLVFIFSTFFLEAWTLRVIRGQYGTTSEKNPSTLPLYLALMGFFTLLVTAATVLLILGII